MLVETPDFIMVSCPVVGLNLTLAVPTTCCCCIPNGVTVAEGVVPNAVGCVVVAPNRPPPLDVAGWPNRPVDVVAAAGAPKPVVVPNPEVAGLLNAEAPNVEPAVDPNAVAVEAAGAPKADVVGCCPKSPPVAAPVAGCWAPKSPVAGCVPAAPGCPKADVAPAGAPKAVGCAPGAAAAPGCPKVVLPPPKGFAFGAAAAPNAVVPKPVLAGAALNAGLAPNIAPSVGEGGRTVSGEMDGNLPQRCNE